jgi:hypothetical protein
MQQFQESCLNLQNQDRVKMETIRRRMGDTPPTTEEIEFIRQVKKGDERAVQDNLIQNPHLIHARD